MWTAPTQELKPLENDLALMLKEHPVQAKVRTTDATVTVLYTATIPVSTTVVVQGLVAARRTGGSAGSAEDGAGYVIAFTAKNDAGTAAVIASSITAQESQTGWNVTLVASGGTIQVKVTGAIDNNVSWVWSGKKLSVKE